jgi:hypothetical protein
MEAAFSNNLPDYMASHPRKQSSLLTLKSFFNVFNSSISVLVSSVSIATGYRLDSRGSISGKGKIFLFPAVP